MRRLLLPLLLAVMVAAPAAVAHPPAKQPTAVGRAGVAASVDPAGTRAAVEVQIGRAHV